MSDNIIRAERLGKSYRLRHQSPQRYVALRDVLTERARTLGARLRGRLPVENAVSEEFWALRDVSFDVERGEVIGIIGRNGAGKSTLLKILSRITEPTQGRVRLRGRVASLLEVGTGFHPELTGRENIQLNGAILGMSRAEIALKFEEIVAFAEVEKFLDTPVKRYSSGMYVRLAFAVAAHLEPEVLVVDEVLAVGDAEFQARCLGKMRDVSWGGRTVLFVSHNMAAVQSLTARGIVLNGGQLVFDGPTERAIEYYTDLVAAKRSANGSSGEWGEGTHSTIRQARLIDADGQPTNRCRSGESLQLEVIFETDGRAGMSLEAILRDANHIKVGFASLYQFHGQCLPDEPGVFCCNINLEPFWLASGTYSIDLTTSVINSNWDHYVEDAVEFEVPFANPNGKPWDFKQSYGYGNLALLCRAPAGMTPLTDGVKPRRSTIS